MVSRMSDTPCYRERLQIVFSYSSEMELDPGKTIEYHYTWMEHWMWVAVNEIEEELKHVRR